MVRRALVRPRTKQMEAVAGGRTADAEVAQFSKQACDKVLRTRVTPIAVGSGTHVPVTVHSERTGGQLVPAILISTTMAI